MHNEWRSVSERGLGWRRRRGNMGTGERRKREARQRRESILAAARRLFRERGFAGTTMPQIAEEAELAPGTLYLYFAGKDSLYAELLTEGYEVLQQRLLDVVADASVEPAEAAGGLIDVFFEFAREYPEYFEIIFFVLQREGDVGWQGFPEEQVRRFVGWEAACREAVSGVLERIGHADASRRERTVQALWTMLAGVVFYCSNRAEFEDVAREAKSLLLSAVLKPSP
jgi:AcrR family transcriptional regulator